MWRGQHYVFTAQGLVSASTQGSTFGGTFPVNPQQIPIPNQQSFANSNFSSNQTESFTQVKQPMETGDLGDTEEGDFMDLDDDQNNDRQQVGGMSYQDYNHPYYDGFQYQQPYYQQPMQAPAKESDDDFDIDSLLNMEMFKPEKPKVVIKKKVMESRVFASSLNRKKGVAKRNAEYLTKNHRTCYNHLLMVSNIKSYIKQWKIKNQRVFVVEQVVRRASGVRSHYTGLGKKVSGFPVVATGVAVVDINQGGVDVVHLLKCHPYELDRNFLKEEVMKYFAARRRSKDRQFTGGKPVTSFNQMFKVDNIMWSPRQSPYGRK